MAATRLTAREPAVRGGPSAVPARAFVVDASVSAAWVLPDEATAFTAAALQATAAGEVWVPVLWGLEMTNLLQSAQRRKRITAAKRAELAAAAAGIRLQVCREPVALTENEAVAPASTAIDCGCVPITGATARTVNAAALLVTEPPPLETTTRKLAPSSASVAGASAKLAEIAPAMSAPLRCHW